MGVGVLGILFGGGFMIECLVWVFWGGGVVWLDGEILGLLLLGWVF